MQEEIIQKIDLLVEMSDTNNHYESLREELKILEMDISKNKDLFRSLEHSMVNGKYVKASERIIDENIKISLENKLADYSLQMEDIKSQILEISKEEEEYHQIILELEDEIHTTRKFLDSLELKMKTIGSKDKSIYSFYEDLIDTASKDIKTNEFKLETKKVAYEQIQKRMASYGEKRSQLEEKMQKDADKLEETNEVLNNPNSYVDERLKRNDEEELQRLSQLLETMEARRLEILTDPSYIGHEATELFLNEDIPTCIEKLRELVTIVKSKPYMDYRLEDLDDVLDAAMQKRDEYANFIESKKYDGTDIAVLDQRIAFLKDCVSKKEEEELELEKRIREMDTDSVKQLMDLITAAKKDRDDLKSDIDEYKKVMEENSEYKTPKKKASLTAAFHRKCEELEQVEAIIDSYEMNLEDLVSKSKELEKKELGDIKADLQKMEDEIHSIEKKKLFNNHSQDILAMEKDKNELKVLADDVEKIMHRKKYHKMPDEIFDEIEISLNSFYEADQKPYRDENEDVKLDTYRIDTSFDDEVEDTSTNESLNTEGSSEEVQDTEEATINEESSLLQEPSEVKEEENTIEEVPQKEEQADELVLMPSSLESVESLEDNDYMVNDFEDTDYINFNDLIEENKNSQE